MTRERPGWHPPAGSPPGTIGTANLDVVYIVRPGENEELRYSLRSLAANLPHANVWIVGHCPRWVRGVRVIELDPLPEKFANQRQSLTAAITQDALTQSFVLMNDDMFVMRRLDPMPVHHLGPLADLTRDVPNDEPNPWHRGLVATQAQMRRWGYSDPNAYEAHTPLPFDKSRLRLLLTMTDTGRDPFLWGCAYDACGSLAGVPGLDAKVASVRRKPFAELLATTPPFLSTNDDSFARGVVGEYVRRQFPMPCIYEEAS